MESDTMILLLITISLIVIVVYNQFIKCDKENDKKINRGFDKKINRGFDKKNNREFDKKINRGYDKEEFRNFNNSKKVSVMTNSLGDNSIKKKDLYKYNKIYRKNICLDNKNKKKYKNKMEIVENEIDSLDNLLNNNNENDMKSLNNIDNNTLSDIETFVK
jgi:acyl-ACP thioesterase